MNSADEDRRQKESWKRKPRTEPRADDGEAEAGGAIRPDRIKAAMSDVQDAQHAEDQGQSDGDHEDQRRISDAVEDGERDQLSGHGVIGR